MAAAKTPVAVTEEQETASSETVVETKIEKKTLEPVSNAKMNLNEADARRKNLVGYYQAEEKVPMYLSPMYRPYLGRVMQVMINGVSIFFQVDGSTQYIPKTFADEIVGKRLRIDSMLARQQKLADIPQNYESSPGELKLF